MQNLACLNGERMPVEEARVPINDRGFLFADAVYEVCRIYRGRCWLEDEHFARLGRSLAEVQIGGIDLDRLRRCAHDTIAEAGIDEGTVYFHITRGAAPRRHAFPGPEVPPTELIVASPYDDTATARLREAGATAITHPDLRWKRCDIKTTNLLANCMANEAAHRVGAYEAVLVGADGLVTEATHSSLLWARAGRLEATPEGPELLPGTTRQFLLKLAVEEGIPFVESRVTPEELLAADEVLMAGTTIEVFPIVALDGRPLGEGRPGPLTRRIQAAFRRAVEAWLAPVPAL